MISQLSSDILFSLALKFAAIIQLATSIIKALIFIKDYLCCLYYLAVINFKHLGFVSVFLIALKVTFKFIKCLRAIIVIIEFILVTKQQMELKLKVSFAVIANHSNHFYLNYSVLAIIHLLINPIITAIIIIHR